MAFWFQCVLKQRELPELWCTIRGVDDQEYCGVTEVLDGAVYQLREGGNRVQVALLQRIICYAGDFIHQRILFQEGCLGFSECCDVPLSIEAVDHYVMNTESGPSHVFLRESCCSTANGEEIQQKWIEFERIFYPVHIQSDSGKKHAITVYRPEAEQKNGLLCYRPLAQMTCTAEDTWDIWMDAVPKAVLGMTICSLPMTA